MTIAQVYDRYHLMPNLQTHMYRVTAVAEVICDHFSGELDGANMIQACLLHDMGNIIKFDLKSFPQFLQPKGLEYWEQIQNEYKAKYGMDEHFATKQIVQELGVSLRVYELIDAIGFHKTPENFVGDDYAKKICEYADDRVTPFGVVSLQERCDDLEKRYSTKYPTAEDAQKRQEFRAFAQKIEEQIFIRCSLKPDEITDEAVNKRVQTLPSFEVVV